MKKIEKTRDFLERPTFTALLFVVLLGLATINFFLAKGTTLELDEMYPAFVPRNLIWKISSGIFLLVIWLPEIFNETRGILIRVGNIIRYSITVWFLWVIVNYVLAVYLYSAFVWMISI
jgi:hypothetical protein